MRSAEAPGPRAAASDARLLILRGNGDVATQECRAPAPKINPRKGSMDVRVFRLAVCVAGQAAFDLARDLDR